jgi:hypothetical protein
MVVLLVEGESNGRLKQLGKSTEAVETVNIGLVADHRAVRSSLIGSHMHLGRTEAAGSGKWVGIGDGNSPG